MKKRGKAKAGVTTSLKYERDGKGARLEKLVAGLRQSRDGLGATVKRQADSLRKKNGELRNGADRQAKSEEHIRILTKAMESIADGIFIIDAHKPKLSIVYANRSYRSLAGWAIPHDNSSLRGVGLRINEKISEMIRENRTFHGEMLSVKKNGKRFWYLLRITPVHDTGGNISHFIGIQTDVTRMRQREAEVDEQREELLHVTRVGKLAEFVSSLAHEISQPLTAILSYAQAAQRVLADREPELQKILSYIINDNRRASGVIQRLHLLLKKGKPEMKAIDINALVDDTVMLIATDATIRNDVLRIELGRDLPRVHGDRIQLQQVLLNLISNSLDALENSRGKREILIRTSRKESAAIMVEVKDSGCGIPAKDMSKLFTRFFTSKSDGLGMGLSISRSIIESHGGRLDVKNNPDRGATFYFTIPIDTTDG